MPEVSEFLPFRANVGEPPRRTPAPGLCAAPRGLEVPGTAGEVALVSNGVPAEPDTRVPPAELAIRSA